jgi:phage-related protein
VKRLVWLGDSLQRLREFPAEVRRAAGYQLERVQAGGMPADWKPMPSVGLGVTELRLRVGGAWRVIYVAKFTEAVYVIHAFQKKTRKTAVADIALARARFGELAKERRRQWDAS